MSAMPHTPHAASRRSRPAMAGALVLAVALAACSSSASSPAEGTGGGGSGTVISLAGSAFTPDSVTVPFGEAIVFNNDDGRSHRIAQGENGTEVADPAMEAISLAAGEASAEIRFSPGTYSLTCTIHPDMNMTLTVEEE